jgi:hypothetical protein
LHEQALRPFLLAELLSFLSDLRDCVWLLVAVHFFKTFSVASILRLSKRRVISFSGFSLIFLACEEACLCFEDVMQFAFEPRLRSMFVSTFRQSINPLRSGFTTFAGSC